MDWANLDWFDWVSIVAAALMLGTWLVFIAGCYWVLCTSHDDRARLHCAKILVGWLTLIAVLAISSWLRD